MAKIYKFEGYIVAPNGEDIDIEHLIDRYSDGFPFIRTNEYEEFEWDDDLEVNCTDDYWAADKLFCQLAYERAVKELKEYKENRPGCKNCKFFLSQNEYCMIRQDYLNNNTGCGRFVKKSIEDEFQEKCGD